MIPPPRPTAIAAAAAALLLAAGCSTFEDKVHPKPGEITVSSANYVTTSVKDLEKSFNNTDIINPKPPPLRPPSQPQTYLFAQGEFYQSDISFDDVCMETMPVLADRGYLQAVNAKKTGRNPDNRIDLVLRVHAGERYWRDPIVRDDYLTWNDQLDPKKTWETADTSGNSTVWNIRAGGDDEAASAALEYLGVLMTEGSPKGGKPPPAGATYSPGDNPFQDVKTKEIMPMPTQDFFIVVIEAYDFKELQKKHGDAERLWTTFMAVPKNGNQKFSQVLPAMLKAGEPYFGDTTSGLVVYQPGHVELGTPYVVPTPAPPAGKP